MSGFTACKVWQHTKTITSSYINDDNLIWNFPQKCNCAGGPLGQKCTIHMSSSNKLISIFNYNIYILPGTNLSCSLVFSSPGISLYIEYFVPSVKETVL